MLGQELTVSYLKVKILYLDPNWPWKWLEYSNRAGGQLEQYRFYSQPLNPLPPLRPKKKSHLFFCLQIFWKVKKKERYFLCCWRVTLDSLVKPKHFEMKLSSRFFLSLFFETSENSFSEKCIWKLTSSNGFFGANRKSYWKSCWSTECCLGRRTCLEGSYLLFFSIFVISKCLLRAKTQSVLWC